MRHKAVAGFIFLFLLTSLFPLPVSAAGKDAVTKEQVFVTDYKEEAAYKKQTEFQKKIKEKGKSFELQDITYEVLETRYLDKKEKVVKSKSELKDTFTEDGQVYQLIKSEKSEEVKTPEQEQSVTAYDEYDHEVSSLEIPDTKVVETINTATGKSETVTCSFTGIIPNGTVTVANQMTITFQDYDAVYYEYQGSLIPKNEEVPALAGYEDQLLAGVGAAPGSIITGITWAGEPYPSADGILCRDATAEVQQVVQQYRANYQGVIRTPEEKSTVYTGTYETPDKTGRVEYKVQAVAVYKKISLLPYVLTGAGLLLLLGAIVSILIIIAKKRGKKEHGTT